MMTSNTADDEGQRWDIVQEKVFNADELTLDQKAAAWNQLAAQDLSSVERRLNVPPERLTAVLRANISGKCLLSGTGWQQP